MSYYLFLDDIRLPHNTKHVDLPPHCYTVVKSYDEFCNIITEKGLPKYITFDHDLCDTHYQNSGDIIEYKEKTGYDCAKWLVDYCEKHNTPLPEYNCHSMNPFGKLNILSLLDSYKKVNNM